MLTVLDILVLSDASCRGLGLIVRVKFVLHTFLLQYVVLHKLCQLPPAATRVSLQRALQHLLHRSCVIFCGCQKTALQMGNWISVYTDELDVLGNIVRSGDASTAEKAVSRYKEKAGPHAKDATMDAIRRLVQGKYEPGAQADGHILIYAFEHLCRAYSRDTQTVEIEVNEDDFPEIFDFVWKSKSDPFKLPRVRSGTPICAHWTNAQVRRFHDVFKQLDFEHVRERTDSDYSHEIEALCKVLQTASESDQGVFVFFNE